MTVTLTVKKVGKILQLCEKFSYPGRHFILREVASFIGTLVSSFPGVELGPLHYRHIEADKELDLKLTKENFESLMTLSHDRLEDVTGGLQIFRQPREKSSVATRMYLFTQMRLKLVGVLILTVATSHLVSCQSLSHSDT